MLDENQKSEPFIQGGVYLVKLNPKRGADIGKTRPAVVLTNQQILDVLPDVVFVCPLSSQSYEEYELMHIQITERDNLQQDSYAIVEQCRTISVSRIIQPRIAQISHAEHHDIIRRLSYSISWDHP